MEVFPVLTILLRDIIILVVNGMGRGFNLDVAARAERNLLALRDAQAQLFNEGSNVFIGNNGAFPFLNAEYFSRQLDFAIVLDGYLAGKTPAFTDLTLGEVRVLNRQNVAAAFYDFNLALTASTAAAAG